MAAISMPALFPGKVHRVHSANALEVDLDLGFGVFVRKIVVMDGYSLTEVPVHLRKDAMHCLVVLAGGKRVLVEPDASQRENWGRSTEIYARVYRAEKVVGTPVGLSTNLPGFPGNYLDMGLFLKSLAVKEFPVKEVHAILNGKHG